MGVPWRRRRSLQICLLALAWLTLAGGCPGPPFNLPLVGVIQWDGGANSFQERLAGLLEGLREEGYQDGLNFKLEVVDAQRDRSRVAAAARRWEEQGARLIITLGVVSTLVTLEITRQGAVPIVYSMMGAPASLGLALPAEKTDLRFTGTSDAVPPAEQLRFLVKAKPSLRHLGVLYCSVTPEGEAAAAAVDHAARAMGLAVIRRFVPDERESGLLEILDDLFHQQIDALFIPADPVLSSPRILRCICDRALKAGVPVMTAFQEGVRAGALMAYHGDNEETGRQTGRQAALLLAGFRVWTVAQETPRIKRLTLNLQVAQELRLPLSRALLSRAYHLYP
ncbi:MAG: hypothetical protein FJ128_08600 [Deltaproteobacteria bacterium]|nr:hypothetical protein [Deltaproteobacteria bacterium]